MSNSILSDVRFLYNGHDLSGDGNSLAIAEKPVMLDATRFTDTAKINRPGLVEGTFSYAGFSQFGIGLVEETIANQKGLLTNVPVFASVHGNAGDVCKFFIAQQATLNPLSGKVGDIQAFTVDGVLAAGPGVVDGAVLESGKIVRVATGAGSAGTQVGAILSTQSAYAILQLLAIDAGTVVVTIQSSADNTFGSPTTRFTFTSLGAAGGLYALPLAGAVTDTWWRAFLTLAGGAAAVQAAVAIGIR